MGACDFFTTAKGKTAREAFDNVVEEAKYENGHGGYTGTIAEKNSFTVIELPEGQEAYAYANDLMDEDDDRIYDKWGPAGCIKAGENEFIFFGYASS